jgi:hypothetical protein
MNRFLSKAFATAVMVSVVAGQLCAQRPSTPLPTNTAGATATGITPSAGSGAFRSGPRPYREVITDRARSQRGMLTVHKVDDKYYFELPDSILGKEILAVTRFVKVPWGGGVYGGEEANENVLMFEKGPDNKIFLRVSLNVVESPDSTKPIFQAVSNSSVDPIAAAFDIRAFGRDSTSTIIDVTDFFRGDNQIVSLDPGTKRRFSLSGLAPDRSYIESMRTYPMNTEIRSVKTFGAAGSSPFASASPIPGGNSLPAAQAAGAVTTTINTSLLLLPARPMMRRAYDPRVGFFNDRFVEFSDSSQKVDENEFIVRWRLEPKAADVERWKRGELVEPRKPIIYYIDPATPKQWRPYLIAGINDWQVAFEKAGFRNAIQGREWPVDDSSMSLEDARFSAIRYFASDIENAYGPQIHDPRTGEILESHIGWYHNVMKLLHDWYFIQAGVIDPRARSMRFSDSLMGQLVRFVSSHEIGHTLGLRHNMGSSSKTPVELLRNKAWVEAHGHTASIMDYARFNYVAQPEDNVGPAGIYPRIGDYDKWAIQWGYRYSGATTEAEDKKLSNKLIIDSLKNPRLWFGGEGRDNDPRSQTEDLSDNNVKASEYGIKNLKRIITSLPTWTKEEGDRYDNMEEMYGQVVAQMSRYVGHVSKHIGGVYATPKSVEQEGDVYAVTPKADQKAALNFLNANLFETPTWLLDKNLLNKFSNPGSAEGVQSLQVRTLNSLLSSDRLGRMVTSANRDAAAYTADEMMTDLQRSIWSELTTKKPIDNYRRNLQKNYVETLIGLLPGAAPASSGLIITIGGRGGAPGGDPKLSDVSSLARGGLSALATQVRAALPTTTDKMSRYHLQDVLARITYALDPR